MQKYSADNDKTVREFVDTIDRCSPQLAAEILRALSAQRPAETVGTPTHPRTLRAGDVD